MGTSFDALRLHRLAEADVGEVAASKALLGSSGVDQNDEPVDWKTCRPGTGDIQVGQQAHGCTDRCGVVPMGYHLGCSGWGMPGAFPAMAREILR